MNTNSEGVREHSFSPFSLSQTNFGKLTKAQLVSRLKYAEDMMIHMRDWYKKDSLKPASHPYVRDYERGFAAAMDAAIRYVSQGPDWTGEEQEDEVS